MGKLISLINAILAKFGYTKMSREEEKKVEENVNNIIEYSKIDDLNIGAIFSCKLANLTTTDSKIVVRVDKVNKDRARIIEEIINQLNEKLNTLVAFIYGTGGVVVIPSVYEDEIYLNFCGQDRLVVHKEINGHILECSILNDIKIVNNKKYLQYINYMVVKDYTGTSYLFAKSKAIDEGLNEVTEDFYFKPVDYVISDMKIVPIVLFKCNINNKKLDNIYGEPIAKPAEILIERAKKTLRQIEKEFELKKIRVFADDTMFLDRVDENGNKLNDFTEIAELVTKLTNSGDEELMTIFSPEIRDSSYYNKLENDFGLIEKAIGTSRGILTKPTTQMTATEVKANISDTYSIVNIMRKELENKVKDIVYIINVLINYMELAPIEDENKIELTFDWNYDLIEDTSEAFDQLLKGFDKGAVKKEELRQYLFSEDIETSKKIIKEINGETK